jgi:hypothetical protein
MEDVLPEDQRCTGLMKIMAKQATNRARTIKLLSVSTVTLEELFKVHFPHSKLTGGSGGSQVSRTLAYAKAQRTGETGTIKNRTGTKQSGEMKLYRDSCGKVKST